MTSHKQTQCTVARAGTVSNFIQSRRDAVPAVKNYAKGVHVLGVNTYAVGVVGEYKCLHQAFLFYHLKYSFFL